MKRILSVGTTLVFVAMILFAHPSIVRAGEEVDAHSLETVVGGYTVTLASENDWTKGENTIVVTLKDSMGMPLQNADVEILITPASDEHGESEADSGHGAGSQEAMPGMDMGGSVSEAPTTDIHVEETAIPVAMMETDESGVYMVEAHLEDAGEHDVHIMFNAKGEQLQANFVVETPGTSSKALVLWSFVIVNVTLIASAGVIKKQSIPVKGVQ